MVSFTEEASKKVIAMFTETIALVFYCARKPVVISADASSYGVVDAIFHQFEDEMKPIVFASGTLTTAETR